MNLDNYLPIIYYRLNRIEFVKDTIYSTQDFPTDLFIKDINYILFVRGEERLLILSQNSTEQYIYKYTITYKKKLSDENLSSIYLGYHNFRGTNPASQLFDKLTQLEFNVCEKFPWVKRLIGVADEFK